MIPSKKKELEEVKTALKQNGYPITFFEKVIIIIIRFILIT